MRHLSGVWNALPAASTLVEAKTGFTRIVPTTWWSMAMKTYSRPKLTHQGGPMAGALNGVTVLEVADYITGPYAGMLLADMGAEVVKIEKPPRGDPFRGFDRNSG